MAKIEATEQSSTDATGLESSSNSTKHVWQTPNMDKLKVQKTEGSTPNTPFTDGANAYS